MEFPLHDFHCMLKDEFMHYESINADSNQKFWLHRKKPAAYNKAFCKRYWNMMNHNHFLINWVFSICYLKRAMNIVQSYFPINSFQEPVKTEITYYLEY